MTGRARLAVVLAACGWWAACVPDLHTPDVIPETVEMQFDPTTGRVPQPTSLVINPGTGHIDFSVAGIVVPTDCTNADMLAAAKISAAECLFDQYLQSLDGFPTVTPATAPASAALDPATFMPGTNVAVVATKAMAPVAGSDLITGFDPAGNFLDVRPKHWTVGEFYWAAVRGYANGIKAADGAEVIGSQAQLLLKQDSPLTC